MTDGRPNPYDLGEVGRYLHLDRPTQGHIPPVNDADELRAENTRLKAELAAIKARRCETCKHCTINECEYANGSEQVFATCHYWKFTSLGVKPDFGCKGWQPAAQESADAE